MARNNDANWGSYLSLGLEIAVGVALGVFVGRWLDRKYGWDSWGTMIGAMLGLAAGMYLLIREAIRMNRDK